MSAEEHIKATFNKIRATNCLKADTLAFIEEQKLRQAELNSCEQNSLNVKQNNEIKLTSSKTLCTQKPSQNGLVIASKECPAYDRNSLQAFPTFYTKRSARILPRKFAFTVAACLLLCLFALGGFRAYATETAVVGIEINPSIELGINRFDIVVDSRALNADGEYVLEFVAVTGKSYDEALALITECAAFQSYIEGDSFVNIYVTCDNEGQSAALIDRGQQRLNTLSCKGSCERVSNNDQQQTQHQSKHQLKHQSKH